MRYPSCRMDSTQDSAPVACQCLQCIDRQPPNATDETSCQEDFVLASPRLRPGRPEPDEKGVLPLRRFRFPPCWMEEEEEAVWAVFCDRSTTGEVPPRSAEEADVDPARTSPTEDFQGIFGGCRVFWTRASFDAARILSGAESSNRKKTG